MTSELIGNFEFKSFLDFNLDSHLVNTMNEQNVSSSDIKFNEQFISKQQTLMNNVFQVVA